MPELAAPTGGAAADVLACTGFPARHRAKIGSANPLARAKGEVERRADGVGVFPDEAAVIRLVGALLLEQNDGWAVQRRCTSPETMAPISDDPAVKLPAGAA